MVFFASFSDLSGILSTQVGDPLAHCQEGLAHAASFDRLSTVPFLSVAYAKDKEVAQLRFMAPYLPQYPLC